MRPPIARPLTFFILLLIAGGVFGAIGSFWWSARWYSDDTGVAGEPPEAIRPPAPRPPPEASEYANRPGWQWLFAPGKWQSGRLTAGTAGVLYFAEGESGVDIMMARREDPPTGPPAPRYEAIGLDADGNRVATARNAQSGNGNGASLRRFWIGGPDAATSEMAKIGIEVLTAEGWRTVSNAAQRKATDAGIATLPYPVLGEPLPFEFPLAGGGRIRGSDYAGQVVLIDCWASWCKPCMEKMPAMKEIRERFGERGLAIIGINFDLEWKRAEAAIAKHGIDWPQVFAGGNFENLELWSDASTVTGIPRFFLIDREGVLRWNPLRPDTDELARVLEEVLAG